MDKLSNMNIFEKNLVVQNNPWPHVEIENFLKQDFATEVVTKFHDQQFRDNWWAYIKENEEKYLKLIGDTFNFNMELLQLEEFNWVPWPGTETRERLKPIHVDGRAKKFQILMYFGTDTPNGGELTFNDGESETVLKNFPFKHNRLIMWPSNRTTYHTFYSLINDTRYTLNIPIANAKDAIEDLERMLVNFEEKLKSENVYDFYTQRLVEKKSEYNRKFGSLYQI